MGDNAITYEAEEKTFEGSEPEPEIAIGADFAINHDTTSITYLERNSAGDLRIVWSTLISGPPPPFALDSAGNPERGEEE